jgi:hypothetical protein
LACQSTETLKLKELEIEPMNENEKTVEKLLKKSVECEKSEDAMRFSQSALNCSHAMQVLSQTESSKKQAR